VSWAKLDDGFYDHPKVLATSNAAIGLYCKALTYCGKHLTDGVIPAAVVTRNLVGTDAEVDELLRNNLWTREAETYRVINYLRYQTSSKSVKKERKRAKQGMRALRARRARGVTRNTGLDWSGKESSSLGKKRAREKKGALAYSTPFLRFWGAYPARDGRRDKKAEAWREWQTLAPDETLQATLLRALLAYRVDKPVDACRWLKHRRWEDEAAVRTPRAVPPRNPELERIKARDRELGRG